MPDLLVIRLTPTQPIDPNAFTNFLQGLTIKIYDISSAHPKAGLPGDATPPIGTAVYHDPTDVIPVPLGVPPLTYPAGTTIAQHYTPDIFGPDIVGVQLQSVATTQSSPSR
jgi:hypothetical protein